MRILLLNKFLYPKGGSETHLLALASSLSQQGHQVEFFGMDHPENITRPEDTTAVPRTDYEQLGGIRERIKALGTMLFSGAAYRGLAEHLRRTRPDVAHAHNIYHQLSVSVLLALRRAGLPVVLTAHDYKLICPSYSLYDGQAGCFQCRGHRYWQVLATGCSRHGTAAGMALMLEAYVHHFLRLYEQLLDTIVSPSTYLRDRLVEGGFAPNKIRVLPNAVQLDRYPVKFASGDYLLCVGRLSYEKGLPTLIQAARSVPQIPIVFAGDGPLRNWLNREASSLPNVRVLGSVPRNELIELLRNARAIVLASQVPENCPMSVLEAFAVGKPVIATRVGGVPELVQTGVTGILTEPGDSQGLAGAMLGLWSDPGLCRDLGIQARRRAEERHDLRAYTAEMIRIYRALVGTSNGHDGTVACAPTSDREVFRCNRRPPEEQAVSGGGSRSLLR